MADKLVWLEQLGAEVSWPTFGEPEEFFVDDGAEFRSEALSREVRGARCAGIVYSDRSEGMLYYGGVVERLTSTLMREVHELPGTTFSNPAERGACDSRRCHGGTRPSRSCSRGWFCW